MSSAITEGVRIRVQTRYLASQSQPRDGRFAFAYTVHIENESEVTVQLRTRHWIISDAEGGTREVRGPGVVGEEPRLEPGETFEYTSGAVLPTNWGTMQGSYRFERSEGGDFDAEVAPFLLASSSVETAQTMN